MTQNCSCHGSGGKYSQTVAAVLERPRYSPGLILEDSDLTSAVDYTQALSRLLFRNLFGCGVICGLTVTVEEKCGLTVTVAPGLALDGCGDPVQLPGPVKISIDDTEADKLKESGKPFWIILCGTEKMCQPRALVCESDEFDGVTQPTRIRALSEVSISFEEPECICGCPTRGDDTVAGPADSDRPAERDTCHDEHAARDDCAEDCGCGTACDCGCCVLLAKASGAESGWTVQHKGVRRRVRAMLVPDREPKTESVAQAGEALDTKARRKGTSATAQS